MAVYTDVGTETLDRFLADYDLGPVRRFEGILQGIENSNFFLETAAGRFVLTVFERRAAEADLPYFMALMQHLAERGFPAPMPLRTRRDAVLGRIAGKPAAIVTFLEGDWPRLPTERDAAAAGAGLAKLHLAAADFDMRRENDLGAARWRRLFLPSADAANGVAPGLRQEIEDALSLLERDWPAGLPSGPIHADLFPDNLFLQNGAFAGAIDFYFACDDALAYDLAITLNAWAFDDEGVWREGHADALVAGYESVRPLSGPERDAMPLLLTGAAMRFLLTRLHDWLNPPTGALGQPKDPLEQRDALRFHRSRLT